MRMNRCYCTSFVLVSLTYLFLQSALPALAFAQRPKQLMVSAWELNDLVDPAVGPWHLRATFQMMDADGKPIASGSYEEYWISPTQFKRSYSIPSFYQTDFGTTNGIMRAGTQENLKFPLQDLHHDFADPFLARQTIDQYSFGHSSFKLHDEKLKCLRITSLSVDPGMEWCVQPDSPVLRRTFSKGMGMEVLRDRPVSFRGRIVPGDIEIRQNDKLLLTAHLESIEAIDTSTSLQPTADALPWHRKIQISGGVAASLLLHFDPPVYPPNVKVSGTVMLTATIGVDGHVKNLEVVSGPGLLRQAVADAVSKWTYRPYLLDGEPVEVITTINVAMKR
jgi:Gram-negative bacterial TonB protein C-terminal